MDPESVKRSCENEAKVKETPPTVNNGDEVDANTESTENETPEITKDSPYPLEDDQLYLMQFKEKHDTINYLVQGIHNASRKAYDVIKERWDDGDYYRYDREYHQELAKEYKDLKESHKLKKVEFTSILDGYEVAGEESKVLVMRELIDTLDNETKRKLSDIRSRFDYEGYNENIYLLMQLPKEEAVRRTGRRTRSGRYLTIGILEERDKGEYEGFTLEKINISHP